MKARLITFIIVLTVASSGFAQISLQDKNRNVNRNNVYLELGGSGYYYSVNLEKLIVKSSYTALFARLGLEYIPIRDADRILHIPVGANLLLGDKRGKLEVGIGALFRLDFSQNNIGGEGYYLTSPPTRIFMAPVLGYRWHSKPNEYGEQFMLRFAFTPLLGMNVFTGTPFFVPWAGISIGRSWQNNEPKRSK